MNKSEKIDQLLTALSLAQAEIEGASKTKVNPHFKSNYADLESVWQAVRGPLTSQGLSVVQSVHENRVVTLLGHKSGQWLETSTELKCKDPTNPQQMMAALTYFRRGMLSGMTGTPQVDDDGNYATQGENKNATTNNNYGAREGTTSGANGYQVGNGIPQSLKGHFVSNNKTEEAQKRTTQGDNKDTGANKSNDAQTTFEALKEYVIPVGKHKDKMFCELEDDQIRQTKEYYKPEVMSKEKQPRESVKELYTKAIMYLDAKKLADQFKRTVS